MVTQEIVIKRLEQLADDIKKMGIHLRRVVLYGSYAKNMQHQWSDIDVAFVADEFKSIGYADVKLFSSLLIKKPNIDIQPRTYNTRDFTPERDPFVEEILKNGIEIRA